MQPRTTKSIFLGVDADSKFIVNWMIRDLNTQKEALTAEIVRLSAQTPRAVPFAKPSEETVTAYVEDLRSTLTG